MRRIFLIVPAIVYNDQNPPKKQAKNAIILQKSGKPP